VNELALFTGAGGGILGGHLLGWRTVCAVEIEDYPRRVLLARQRDGILPRFPIWDDIKTFDGNPWRGRVDVVSGGFPCQDISAAGKGAGIRGKRSGMWAEMARVVGEVRPRYVFVENSPMLTSRGLGVVLGDLSTLGYDARWGVLGARHVKAPHKRDRIWILATNSNLCTGKYVCRKKCKSTQHSKPCKCGSRNEYTDSKSKRLERQYPEKLNNSSKKRTRNDVRPMGASLANTTSVRQSRSGASWYACDPAEIEEGETIDAWYERVGHLWCIKSPVGRVANGVAHRVDRLKAIGNGQVSSVAKLAWEILTEGLE